jgi:hypothetical protein
MGKRKKIESGHWTGHSLLLLLNEKDKERI